MIPFIDFDNDFIDTEALLFLAGASGGTGVEATATGNPLVFTTDLARPLKSLLIPFTPQQEGTGDPSPQNIRPLVPWNGLKVFGGGKNLFDESEYQHIYTDPDYIWEGIPYRCKYIQLSPNTNYTISSRAGTTSDEIVLINNRQQPNVMPFFDLRNASQTITFKTDETGRLYIGSVNGDDSTTYSRIVECKIQIEVGETATAYEDYKPTTETDIVFPTADENIYNSESYPLSDGYFITAGTGKTSASASAQNYSATLGYIPISDYAGKVLVLNKRPTGSDTAGVAFYASASQSGYISGIANNGETENTPMVFRVPDNAVYMRFSCVKGETGVTLKAVVPVYGGTLDAVSGVLTVEYGFSDLGDYAWDADGASYPGVFRSVEKKFMVYHGSLVCTEYKGVEKDYGNLGDYEITVGNTAINPFLRIKNPNFAGMTGAEVKTALAGVKLAYELATPQEIQLTPAQITALVGDNTIWSDADGQMTAVYLKKG